ncbi:Formylglycine-generating enzyme, required for sulfatase activity, contains SUMF1/FGE domain [Nitrosospira briensis]|nr:Formylglycine-generating enzyme, required for sulfatase activity, contains SUMF1/FGE domain [Nitrosospira briensis]
MKFMKSVYSRLLLVLIFATPAIFVTSAEVSAFVSSSVAERADGALPPGAAVSGKPGSSSMEAAVRLANLEASEEIDENEGYEDKREVLGKEIGITDGVFQKNGAQLLAQLDLNDGKQDEGSKACTDCPEMVAIPGKKFAIGKYAVTFKEWDACVSGGGCGAYLPSDNGWGRGNRPVINVSWEDAQAYIRWLSGKTGKTYRLPTEEEWKIAALAGSTTEYYWGNDVGRNNANCDGCGSEWDNKKTAPVGSFKPNAFGLYDMMGNVWQWTDTCWQANCAKRMFFGGSWNHRPQDMRTTTRNWFNTDKRMRYLGFRLAMTLP